MLFLIFLFSLYFSPLSTISDSHMSNCLYTTNRNSILHADVEALIIKGYFKIYPTLSSMGWGSPISCACHRCYLLFIIYSPKTSFLSSLYTKRPSLFLSVFLSLVEAFRISVLYAIGSSFLNIFFCIYILVNGYMKEQMIRLMFFFIAS